MTVCLRVCLQSTLKILNSVIGIVGMAMIMYSLWMIRACPRKIGEFFQGFSGSNSSPSWFIYTILGLGIFLCVLACSGHIAAETISSHFLSCYGAVICLLLVLEAAITADILLNRNWEEDFPHDTTGRFNELVDFVQVNSGLCKLIGLIIGTVQVVSVFLAMNLRAVGPDHRLYDESDDDPIPASLPLLRNQGSNPPAANHEFSIKKIFWIASVHDKICR